MYTWNATKTKKLRSNKSASEIIYQFSDYEVSHFIGLNPLIIKFKPKVKLGMSDLKNVCSIYQECPNLIGTGQKS